MCIRRIQIIFIYERTDFHLTLTEGGKLSHLELRSKNIFKMEEVVFFYLYTSCVSTRMSSMYIFIRIFVVVFAVFFHPAMIELIFPQQELLSN
jgi:hypothetical protein